LYAAHCQLSHILSIASYEFSTLFVVYAFLQWLKAVLRLQSDIARCLSSGDEPSALKPTASVTPQVKLDSTVDDQEKSQFSSVAVIASQCIPAQVVETSENSPSHSNLRCQDSKTVTNCEVSSSILDRRTPNGLRVNYRTVSEDVVSMSFDNSNCDSGNNTAAVFEQFHRRHSEETAVTQRRKSRDEARVCFQDSLDWNSATNMSTVQSDELAVAHVLSGIGQLAAVAAAAAAIPNVGNNNETLSTRASLVEGSQFLSEPGNYETHVYVGTRLL